MQPANNRKILLAGATGLVGHELLQTLLTDRTVTEIHVLSRRPLDTINPKLHNLVVDYQQLPGLPPVDEVYLAIGTTIRVAGNRAAFRAVDLDMNLAVAKAGIAAGARRVALVSAAGADANSSVFYIRTKGELENALMELALDALVIARPSFLLGDREALGQPARANEKIAIWITKCLSPILPRHHRPIPAKAVAQSLATRLPLAQGKVVLHYEDFIQAGAPGQP
jgi:uncharacterized protein YbjT (DUF2867 family)